MKKLKKIIKKIIKLIWNVVCYPFALIGKWLISGLPKGK